MRRKDDLMGVAGAETLIGTGVRVKGNISSEGDVTIDGTLIGDAKSQGNVAVGVNGEVNGQIKADNVRVLGHVKGDIGAEGQVIITETGNVVGNITTTSLGVSPGAIFIGRSEMKETEIVEMHDDDARELPAPATKRHITDIEKSK